jgi:hypothetical protein
VGGWGGIRLEQPPRHPEILAASDPGLVRGCVVALSQPEQGWGTPQWGCQWFGEFFLFVSAVRGQFSRGCGRGE